MTLRRSSSKSWTSKHKATRPVTMTMWEWQRCVRSVSLCTASLTPNTVTPQKRPLVLMLWAWLWRRWGASPIWSVLSIWTKMPSSVHLRMPFEGAIHQVMWQTADLLMSSDTGATRRLDSSLTACSGTGAPRQLAPSKFTADWMHTDLTNWRLRMDHRDNGPQTCRGDGTIFPGRSLALRQTTSQYTESYTEGPINQTDPELPWLSGAGA